MERMNMVKSGVVRLPPGFRFHPTDEELVVHYLKRKVCSSPLPASIIPDFHVCKSDPWDLPGNKGQERYFFSTREAKYPNGNRSNRATASGYWKATGKDNPIVAGGGRIHNGNHPVPVVGMKKTLVFYRGKPPHGSRTDWIMHEYRLVHYNLVQKTGDWVLCRIVLKKRNNAPNKKDHEEEEEEILCEEVQGKDCGIGKPVLYDFMARDQKQIPTDLNLPAPCSSSSGSSAVTEVSSNEDNDNNNNNNGNSNGCSEEWEESSSCCNSFSSLRSKP